MSYKELRELNVNQHVEKKDGLSYLSWAWAWDIFKQHYTDATYEVLKDDCKMPYFSDGSGAMVYTKVTAGGETHEMWLPVMNGANKSMKHEPYTYSAWDKYKKTYVEKTVEPYTMFDINKTIMRCLVKNLAMFGLGIYIYAGEDLPDTDEPKEPEGTKVDPRPDTSAVENDPRVQKFASRFMDALDADITEELKAELVYKIHDEITKLDDPHKNELYQAAANVMSVQQRNAVKVYIQQFKDRSKKPERNVKL